MTGGSQLGPVMKAFGTIHMRFCYTIVESCNKPSYGGIQIGEICTTWCEGKTPSSGKEKMREERVCLHLNKRELMTGRERRANV